MTMFFQPDHTYQRGRWEFLCLAVAPTPWDREVRAVGYLSHQDGTGSVNSFTMENWTDQDWTDITEADTFEQAAQGRTIVSVTEMWEANR